MTKFRIRSPGKPERPIPAMYVRVEVRGAECCMSQSYTILVDEKRSKTTQADMDLTRVLLESELWNSKLQKILKNILNTTSTY